MHLPALQKQEHQKGGRGSACSAGLQGCHPSSTAGTWGTARIQSYLPSVTAGIQGTACTAQIPLIHHCRDPGHCHGRDRAALPSLHCRHSSTASLALRDAKAPPIRHCRDAGAPCIIYPARRAGHCHPPVPLTETGALPTPVLEGHRLTAHPALQCRRTPQGRPCASPRSSGTAQPQHTAMGVTASPLCCTVTRQPHTLHQQILFLSLTADTVPSHSLPLQTGTLHAHTGWPPCPTWAALHHPPSANVHPTRCRGSDRSTAPLHCRDAHCTRCTAGTQPLETSSQYTHCRGSARRTASPIETIPFCAKPHALSPSPCLVLCLATSFPVPHFPFWEHTFLLQGPGAPTQLLLSREREGVQPSSPAPRKPSGWVP